LFFILSFEFVERLGFASSRNLENVYGICLSLLFFILLFYLVGHDLLT